MWEIIEVPNQIVYQDTLKVAPMIAAFFAYLNLSEDASRQLIDQTPIFHQPRLYHDLIKAKKRIEQAVLNQEKILIYGDYDCDGMLATTILLLAIESLGQTPSYYIPNRFVDGYGITPERVQQFHEKGYSLIITVDNGISAHEAINIAESLGVDVIVTDHHLPSSQPVSAPYVIHPLLSDQLEFKHISGGTVAYKLACSLLNKHHPYLWTLAMITTISDMMPLIDENHSIVKQGLHLLNKYQFDTLKPFFSSFPVVPRDISFKFIPVINTVGRMPEKLNPNNVVKYLAQKMDETMSNNFVEELKALNMTRKSLVEKELVRFKAACQDDIICIFDDTLHEGLTGLIASRFVNQYQKPTFVFALNDSKTIYKGSARSLGAFTLPDVFEALEDLLVTSGGHDYAGGLSLAIEDKEEFVEALSELSEVIETREPVLKGLLIDEPLTLEAVIAFESLQPFGYQFEKPSWILEHAVIGQVTPLKEGKHIKLSLSHLGQVFDAMIFNCKDSSAFIQGRTLSLIGDLSINTFMNQSKITFTVQDYQIEDN